MAISTFNARNRLSAQTDVIQKPEFDAKLKGISDRVTTNKTKHLLVENKLKKIKALDLSYFGGKNYFEGNDGAQNLLVFQVKEKYFEDKYDSKSYSIRKWKSKGLSNKSLSISGTLGKVNDIKMSKLIRPGYIIYNHKRSFFVQKLKML